MFLNSLIMIMRDSGKNEYMMKKIYPIEVENNVMRIMYEFTTRSKKLERSKENEIIFIPELYRKVEGKLLGQQINLYAVPFVISTNLGSCTDALFAVFLSFHPLIIPQIKAIKTILKRAKNEKLCKKAEMLIDIISPLSLSDKIILRNKVPATRNMGRLLPKSAKESSISVMELALVLYEKTNLSLSRILNELSLLKIYEKIEIEQSDNQSLSVEKITMFLKILLREVFPFSLNLKIFEKIRGSLDKKVLYSKKINKILNGQKIIELRSSKLCSKILEKISKDIK